MMAHRLLVISIVMIVSLTGCGLLNTANTTPAAPEAPDNAVNESNMNEAPVDAKDESSMRANLSINDVIDATVRIGVLDAAWQEVGHGTGSVIDARGLILTNFHVIGDNESGQYNNADGIANIYVTLDPRDPPKWQFIAQVVDADAAKDLAVLRIIATTNGEPPADCLNLPAVNLNIDEPVEIGQEITSVGYAGVGGDTVSIASGQVVGFEEFSMNSSSRRSYEAIKYDASDSRGSSGGPIVNDKNEQVAVVFATIDSQGSSLMYARPITLAEDLIASAKLVRIPGCNGAAAAQLAGPQTAQTTQDNTTTAANTGGNQQQSDTFDIVGYVYDRNTNQPIANASIVILKPGYRWDEIDYDRFAEYIWTSAQTDANGAYTLSVTEEMVSTRTGVGFYADGYKTYLNNDTLMIEYYDKDKNQWISLSFEPK